jgi:hypothetical protein
MLAGGVGGHKRDVMLLEKAQSLVLDPARVTDLKCVAQALIAPVGCAKGAAAGNAAVVSTRQALGCAHVARKKLEKDARAIARK